MLLRVDGHTGPRHLRKERKPQSVQCKLQHIQDSHEHEFVVNLKNKVIASGKAPAAAAAAAAACSSRDPPMREMGLPCHPERVCNCAFQRKLSLEMLPALLAHATKHKRYAWQCRATVTQGLSGAIA
eukprot:1003934-Amphidinium_carterae.2